MRVPIDLVKGTEDQDRNWTTAPAQFLGHTQAIQDWHSHVQQDEHRPHLFQPGNLLPYKGEYQEIANGLPQGGILIVLPQELKQRRAFEQTAALLKQQGKRIATISAEHFA